MLCIFLYPQVAIFFLNDCDWEFVHIPNMICFCKRLSYGLLCKYAQVCASSVQVVCKYNGGSGKVYVHECEGV